MRSKLKVVIDTNVFITGMYGDDSYCDKIMTMIENRKLQLYFSQETIGELMYLVKNFGRHYYDIKSSTINDLFAISETFFGEQL